MDDFLFFAAHKEGVLSEKHCLLLKNDEVKKGAEALKEVKKLFNHKWDGTTSIERLFNNHKLVSNAEGDFDDKKMARFMFDNSVVKVVCGEVLDFYFEVMIVKSNIIVKKLKSGIDLGAVSDWLENNNDTALIKKFKEIMS